METVHNVIYEWNHSLGAIVSSLIAHGLVLEFLHEHPFMLWKRWPFLIESEEGIWRLPPEHEALLQRAKRETHSTAHVQDVRGSGVWKARSQFI